MVVELRRGLSEAAGPVDAVAAVDLEDGETAISSGCRKDVPSTCAGDSVTDRLARTARPGAASI